MPLTSEQITALAEFDQRARQDRENLENSQLNLGRVRADLSRAEADQWLAQTQLDEYRAANPSDAGGIAFMQSAVDNAHERLVPLAQLNNTIMDSISTTSANIARSPADRERVVAFMAGRSNESIATAVEVSQDPNATEPERVLATQNAIQDEILSTNTADIAATSLDEDTTIMADAGDEMFLTTATGSGTGEVTDLGDTTDLGTIEVVEQRRVQAQREVDHRVRIRPRIQNEADFYGAASTEGSTVSGDVALMAPLQETNGVIFPYTPTITMAHTANYSQMATVHANQDYYVYNNTPAVQIQIQGTFTAQNNEEGTYMLAAKHFFQTLTKMRFGENDERRGLPPPLVLLSGYGDYMLNDLPVIVTNFAMELPNTVDYVELEVNGAKVWLPSITSFNISCVVQQTPKEQRQFDWNKFASGELMRDRKGWI